MSKPVVIVVEPAKAPKVVRSNSANADRMDGLLLDALGQMMMERQPYPTQLKGHGKYLIYFDEDALSKLNVPYNRWGILGTFAIVRVGQTGRFLSFSESDVEQIFLDLQASKGYLDPRNLVQNAFREPFARYGEPPSGTIPPQGRWFA